MASLISVPCTILWNSGIVEGNPMDGPYAVVRFKCLTTDRVQLVKDLMGTSVKVTGTTGTAIVRTYPYTYPLSNNLICRSIDSIEMTGPPIVLANGNPVWVGKKWSIVTARFSTAYFFPDNSDPSGQPYTQTTFDAAGEVLTLPNGTYKFSGGVPTQTPVGAIIGQMTISMKRFMLPYAPAQQVAALVGKVNNAVVTIGGYAFAAGYLLFVGGPINLSSDTLGNVLYDAEYRMVYRQYPWNYALHPNGTTGWAAVTDGNGNGPYTPADFTTLP